MTGASWATTEGGAIHEQDRVELSLPVRPDLIFLVRMTAAAVASRADFGYDQVEDLRLAIDELCLTLCGEESSDGRIQLLFRWSDDDVEVVGTHARDDDGDRATLRDLAVARPGNELSERILDALVDEHGTDVVGGSRRAWLRMRRRQAGR
ncbi:MAG: ATP-binding protein [Acidimicrobiales bacterium]